MEEATTRKFRWFWAWQDELEEAWLRQMSQEGLHLVSVRPMGIYTFVIGKPQDTVYRLDFISPQKDKPAYLQLFSDAGWEHVGEMSGWQYFRKSVQDGEVPEIFTDVETKVEKYRRLLAFEVIIMIVLAITAPRYSNFIPSIWGEVLTLIFILLLMLYIYIVVKTWMRINQLKRL